MVAALLRPIFNADDREQARTLIGDALDRLRKPLPKVAALLEEAEEDLLAFKTTIKRRHENSPQPEQQRVTPRPGT